MVLHAPRPQRVIPIPLPSSPPPIINTADYQRFSSPPVHAQQQQQPQQQQPYYSSYQPQQQQQQQQQFYTPAHGHQQQQSQPPLHQQQQQQPLQQQHLQQQQQSSYPEQSWNTSLNSDNNNLYGQFGINDVTTQMGVQFGKHAFNAGSAYLDQNFTKFLLPLANLKHSFNVSNHYVLIKLRLLIWPWRHKSWSRTLDRSQVTGMVTGFRPPRDDINCPDLYIPVMAMTTYILLAAVIARPEGTFDPKILGASASTAFALIFLELGMVKLGCYLLGIGDEGTFIDLIAYEGYKFVGVNLTLLAGLLGAKGWVFWSIFIYLFLANFFFLLRSLRSLILPDPASGGYSPLDPIHAHSPSNSGGVGGVGGGIHHAQRSRRMIFLFGIPVAQIASMLLLIWL